MCIRDSPSTVPSNVQSGIESKKGGGSPLPEDTRDQMEEGIGADLSNVRIHDDSASHQMNEDVNAQAFTHGSDVFFGAGKYNPGTDSGDHLLAHELTHTVQQGESPVKKKEDEKIDLAADSKTKTPATAPKADGPAATPLPVTDISKGFKPSKAVEEMFVAEKLNKEIEIPVKIGKLVAGMLKVRQTRRAKEGSPAKYSIAANQGIAYDGLGMFNGLKKLGITPVIAVKKGAVTLDQPLVMYYAFKVKDAVSANPNAFIEQMKKNTEALGMIGFELPSVSASIQNTVAGQDLIFKVSGLKAKVAGYLEGEAEFGKEGEEFTFKAGVNVDVKGLAQGSFSISRDKKGRFAGEGEIDADIANLSGKVGVKYLSTGDVQIRGSLAMDSEKFSGSVSLMVADNVTADKMMKAELGLAEVEQEDKKKPDAKAPAKKTKANQAVAIWGTVEARITPWLTGTATVGIDSKGQVTIIGKIAPPDDVVLMEQNTKKIDLFSVEAKGGYGIPFIGQVGLFAKLGMYIKAGFGPLTLRNIAFEGKYSTDPSVLQNFKITGALNISAFALLALEAEAGLFLTILGHDIKAGVNVTAAAGIKAYAEVMPTFEYQEQNSPEGGKVGEAWLRGHFEAAAQLFLKLSGEFFVELDAPWWSPVGDERWPYPLFDVEYPLGKSMGIGGDVDWLVGSPDLPELKFSPVEFDPDKFTSDIMAEPPKKAGGGKGGEQNGPGEWSEGGKDGKDGKPETKDGKGLKGKKEPKEDVSKMTDDQKFLRACELIGKVGDQAKTKPLAEVQLREKVKRIKSKYRISSTTIKAKDGEATVTVKHKKNDNKKDPIKVKLMSKAEMVKLAKAGQADLEAKTKAKEDPKAHTMNESDAKAIAAEIARKHYVFESVLVVQKGDRWTYELDVAGQVLSVAGSTVPKDKKKEGGEGEFEAVNHMKKIAADSNKQPYTEAEIKFVIAGLKSKYKFDFLKLGEKGKDWVLNEDMADDAKRKGGDKSKKPIQKKDNGSDSIKGPAVQDDTSVSLTGDQQDKMENHFGADFSGVKMYEGDQADSINAKAYTQGDEVHFARGEFQPHTSDGQELIAHELQHVEQQREGRVPTPQDGNVINQSPALENEADEKASSLETSAPSIQAKSKPLASAAGAPIQRTVQIHKDFKGLADRGADLKKGGTKVETGDAETATVEIMKRMTKVLLEYKRSNPSIYISAENLPSKAEVKEVVLKLITAPRKPVPKTMPPSVDTTIDKSKMVIPPKDTLDEMFFHKPKVESKDVQDVHLYENLPTKTGGSYTNDYWMDFARRVIGDLMSKQNQQVENRLAGEVYKSGKIKRELAGALKLIRTFIQSDGIKDTDRANLQAVLKNFVTGSKTGMDAKSKGRYETNYYPWYAHLASGKSGSIFGYLANPPMKNVDGNIAMLHDFADHLVAIAKGKVAADIQTKEFLAAMVDKNEKKTLGTGSDPDGDQIRLGDYRVTNTSVIEFNEWIQTARAYQMPVLAGPSMTAARLFDAVERIGGTSAQKEAVAWAIFAFWNKAYYRATTGVHTFHEVMDVAKNYGVTYSPFEYPEKPPGL